jgi:hypothetical protein
LLCVIAAALSYTALQKLPAADDTQPEAGRRQFMAKLGLILAGLAALIVIAGTIATSTVQPCD